MHTIKPSRNQYQVREPEPGYARWSKCRIAHRKGPEIARPAFSALGDGELPSDVTSGMLTMGGPQKVYALAAEMMLNKAFREAGDAPERGKILVYKENLRKLSHFSL